MSEIDALIFGGGAAGLWLLDELHRRGFSTLLIERDALGSGQTIASQGIIHGGIKYALTGLGTSAARGVRNMPGVWRNCLAGRTEPNLARTAVLAERCFLWRTGSVSSRLGLVGARLGLSSHVEHVAIPDRPPLLRECPGDVYSVNEQVIDVGSFLEDLSQRHQSRIIRVENADLIRFAAARTGRTTVVLAGALPGETEHELQPDYVILSAGAGNEVLRQRTGLPCDAMQRRPLHMVLARGELPEIFGHCIDGAKTRVTITTTTDSSGTRVWQVGGQVAEDGVKRGSEELVEHAQRELRSALPGVNLDDVEWATYRVDRAEERMPGGKRPKGWTVRQEGNVLTVWPTKLALVPELARDVADRLGKPRVGHLELGPLCPDWPHPEVALPPWDTEHRWQS
ncbi:MAG: FAD-dependent oxidoreductase [Planctomycetes bacterium]|nr:FAD-dependent oxidoreductase [Planctomycetota bacterium]